MAKKIDEKDPQDNIPPVDPIVPKEPKEEPEMVQVPVKDLTAIIAKQEAQEKEIERLTAAADLNRLANYDAKSQGKLIRTARLSMWKVNDIDKIILGWKMVKDVVRVVSGVLHEDQIIRLFLDEGEDKKMTEVDVPYRDFGLFTEQMTAEIVERAQNNEGMEFFVLQLPSGRKIKVDTKFIN